MKTIPDNLKAPMFVAFTILFGYLGNDSWQRITAGSSKIMDQIQFWVSLILFLCLGALSIIWALRTFLADISDQDQE